MKKISSIFFIIIGSSLLYANKAADRGLLQALQEDNLLEAKYWLEHGANANCTNGKGGLTALLLAMNNDFLRHLSDETFDNSVALTELLLQHGANPNPKKGAISPLGWAVCSFGDYRLCEVLLRYGANPCPKHRMNVIDYANRCGYTRVAELLANPQTYSTEYTVFELEHLIKISLSHQAYDNAIQYCEQFYRQLPKELSSNTSYPFKNEEIYFYHEIALLYKSNLAVDSTKYDEAEKLVFEAIRYEDERKRLENTRDVGVDIYEYLAQIRAWKLNAQENYNASILYIADKVIQQDYQDTTDIDLLLKAASYASIHSYDHLQEYYHRTAYQWVKANANIRKALSPALAVHLLSALISYGNHILSESEVDEATAYVAKTFDEMSLEAMSYTLSLVSYYFHQDATDKALTVNKALINKLDDFFGQSKSINEDLIDLYISACEICGTLCINDSQEDSYIYHMLKNILDNPLFSEYVHAKYLHPIYKVFILYCSRHSYANEIWSYVPTYYQLNHAKIDYVLSALSEEDALSWWNVRHPFYFDNTILMATKDSVVPEYIAGEIYNNELFKKDILFRSHTRMQQYFAIQQDSTFCYLYQRLTEQKAQLLQYLSSDNYYKNEEIQSLEKSILSTERILASVSNAYAEQLREKDITWQDIQKKLKDNEVAIEFLNTGDIDQYWALLIRKGYKYPKLIYLPDFLIFYPEDITSRMNTWHQFEEPFGIAPPEFLQFAGDVSEVYQYGANGTKLYEALWKPLTQYIRKGETVYFAPSGILHQLAVEALPIDDKHVLSDTYNLIRLSSTRELARLHHAETNKQAVLYGNIQYDVTNIGLLTEQSAKYRGEEYVANRNSSDGLDRGIVKPLPGTAREVQGIFRQLDAAHYQTNLLEKLAANEESVKALSGRSPQILHIATHAFYWDNDRASNEPFVQHRTPQGEDVMINPLARCGLLFAGANIAYSGNQEKLPQGVEDGVLTAEEISLLDLRQTKLLGLSACETGMGELTDVGVLGLQRAFKMAGVETIIMSLWKVDDSATQMLMTEFYTNWIEKKQTKREAFENAQKAVRFAVDKDGDRMYESPYYWAGFIMLD